MVFITKASLKTFLFNLEDSAAMPPPLPSPPADRI